jgi:glycosyltransferase involved in cell wall biosynthesis
MANTLPYPFPDIDMQDKKYFDNTNSRLEDLGIYDGLESSAANGHSLVDHSLGVAEKSAQIAMSLGGNSREICIAYLGGLIHDSGKTLSASPEYSAHDSIALEAQLRLGGLNNLAQSIRHNPYLFMADDRYERTTLPQIAVTIADAGTDRRGSFIGIEDRQTDVVLRKPIDKAFQMQFAEKLINFSNRPTSSTSRRLQTTFIERCDGRYPISSNPETHGKLSSLHIAQQLQQFGISARIIAYTDREEPIIANGVKVIGNDHIDKLDTTIPSSDLVFVTGWTSAFRRLGDRSVPSTLVMRSLFHDSITPSRLGIMQNAGKGLLLVSPESAGQINCDSNETTVIPNGFDPEIFYYKEHAINDRQIFFSGATVLEKGFDYLIELAKTLPDYRFVVAGAAKMYGRNELDLDIPANIQLLGEVDQKTLQDYYGSSLATVFLTDPERVFETFGKSAMEAQLCGSPLLYIENGGLNSTVTSDKLAIGFKSPDIKLIAQTILNNTELFKKSDARRLLAEKAKAKNLTWSQVAARYFARGLDSIIEAEITKRAL